MKFLSFLFALLFISSTALAFESDPNSETDSTVKSSIEFIKMKAVASARIIHFKWDVAAEHHGDYFIIEKSIDDGDAWSKVVKTESIGDHDDTRSYEVSEINMPEGVSETFRIRRVDIYGNSEVLDSVKINQPVLSNFKLIPDPKKPKRAITVTYESLIASEGTMTVLNKEGEEVERIKLQLTDGYNRLVLSLNSFDAGEYLIVIKNEFDDGINKRLIVY